MDSLIESEQRAATKVRAREIFQGTEKQLYRHTDRMFAALMAAQWIAGVIAAVCISPRAWVGQESSIHIHVWAALLLGGVISGLPIVLALTYSGKALTRHVIAVGQMLTSALLIHLTGGRIETHFHVFGSLAFLAFYRDWRVLLTATIVVAADHLARGMFWPQSIFGVLTPSSWRWVEHAAWVLFEDVFLYLSIRQNLAEMHSGAERQAELEAVKDDPKARKQAIFKRNQAASALNFYRRERSRLQRGVNRADHAEQHRGRRHRDKVHRIKPHRHRAHHKQIGR